MKKEATQQALLDKARALMVEAIRLIKAAPHSTAEEVALVESLLVAHDAAMVQDAIDVARIREKFRVELAMIEMTKNALINGTFGMEN